MSVYGLFYAIWRVVRNAGLIVRNEPAGHRLVMLLTYARLQLTFLIGVVSDQVTTLMYMHAASRAEQQRPD